MQKWEYCAIASVLTDGWVTGDPSISQLNYFLMAPDPRIPSVVSLGPAGKGSYDLSQMIAGLGDKGWEMVGCGNVDQRRHTIYFKRPTQ